MRLLKTNLLMTMIALCLSAAVNAQIVIHGTVTDTEGPLVGATVAVPDDALRVRAPQPVEFCLSFQ